MKWFLKALKQYADFNGRARRKEYWMFSLISLALSLLMTWLDNLLGFTGVGTYEVVESSDTVRALLQSGPLSNIYGLAMLIPSLSVTVRRLHDVNKSGWYMLIPLYNLYLMLKNSDKGDNKYGPNPKTPQPIETIKA